MRLKSLLVLVALLISINAAQSNMYKLILHPKDRGAMCIDGSPAGMYVHEGSGQNKNKYLFYFFGGGFCGQDTKEETLDSCYFRSFTILGSTTVFQKQKSFDGQGILSTNPKQNPNFHDWTKIMAIYCDGSCHQGYREEPIVHYDKQMYFRGSRNVLEHFRYMDQNYDWYNGDTIVVTGLSAGGLGVFQWVNYVYDNAKSAKVYAIPDSGFFMTDYKSPLGSRILGNRIQNFIRLIQTPDDPEFTQPINECFLKQGRQGNVVSCFDPSRYANKLKAPIFIIQSPLDEWCLKYVVGLKCLSNRRTPLSLAKCNDTMVAAANQYQKDVISKIKQAKGQRTDIGAWGPACIQHGFLSFPNPTFVNPYYRVPFETGPTLNQAILQFLEDPQNAKWHLQQQTWPNNQGCSGLPRNIRQGSSLN